GDIGRQRRVPDIGDRLIERRTMKGKVQRNFALLALVLDLRVEMTQQADPALVAEADGVALGEFPGRLGQRLPARAVKTLDQRRLDEGFNAPPDTPAAQLRRDDPGVVD